MCKMMTFSGTCINKTDNIDWKNRTEQINRAINVNRTYEIIK